ncbi:MAG TPA: amidohydrolase family protein [Gemmatimonadaceae bacterium]|nr:amidohydrolase family protein [Gemmatimonadaceae bacterium]
MICYRAQYVLPISAPPIVDGVVGVDRGRIGYVGTSAHAPSGRIEDLGDAILLPGLVNAHCHLELTAMRGFLENLDFRAWIVRLTSSKRAVMSREMLLDAARYGIAEGVRHGITTFADTCDSGVSFDAMLESRVRGVMYQEVFGPGAEQCAVSLAELREKVERMRPRQTPLVRVGVSPHAPYTVSDSLFASASQYARSEALPIAIHIAESQAEHDLVADATGPFADGLRARNIDVAARARTPIELLKNLNVLAARPLLIHCVRVDDADVAHIAAARCAVAHCPASNAKLGHGIAPLSMLLDAGIPVGIGSDSVASNNRMDLLDEARLAVLMQRARQRDYRGVSANAVLTLATLGGANALGIEREIGSLEVGKAADLAAFPLRNAGPVHDPEAAAIFALPGTPASFVAVAGEVLVQDGVLIDYDQALEKRVQGSAEALERWLSST